MSQQLASVQSRLEKLLHLLESGRHPGRARVDDTLTDGYAWALKLDAECGRLERSIGTLAAELDHGSSEQQARELSRTARRLARSSATSPPEASSRTERSGGSKVPEQIAADGLAVSPAD
jgi:hypothetical protein